MKHSIRHASNDAKLKALKACKRLFFPVINPKGAHFYKIAEGTASQMVTHQQFPMQKSFIMKTEEGYSLWGHKSTFEGAVRAALKTTFKEVYIGSERRFLSLY